MAFVSLSRNARTVLRVASLGLHPNGGARDPPPVEPGADPLSHPAPASSLRPLTLRLAAAVLLAGPTVLAFFSGGYPVEPQLLGAFVAFTVLGAAIAVSPWPPVSGRGLVALGGLAGYAAWTGASISWAPIRDAAAGETAQAALYAAAFAAALVAMRDPLVRRWAAPALLAGITLVAVYALAGRLLPDVISTEVSSRAGSRLQQPLTYWNALGLLMDFGLLLGVCVCSDPDRSRRLRAAAGAATVPCAAVLFLTFSRGSLVALAAGGVALLLARPARAALANGLIVLAAAAVLAAILQLFPAVLDLGHSSSDQTTQGTALVAIVAVGMVAVAAGVWRLSRAEALSAPLDPGRGARVAIAGLSLAAVIGIGWLIVDSSETTKPLPSSKGRLTTIATNRGDYWRVALDALGDHPVNGAGAAAFKVEWRRERKSSEAALDAHSLYIETLGELGLVGGLALLSFLITALAAVIGRGAGAADPLRTAAAACLIAFLVHVALDWTWEFPAVTLIPLLLVAGVLASPAARVAGRSRGRTGGAELSGERPLDGSAGTRPRPDPVPG